MNDIRFLKELESLISERLRNPQQGSYTSELAEAGVRRMAQKVGEEGVEVALAAVAEDSNALLDESADLVYHLLVLLADQGLSLADVAERLQDRHRG